MSKPSLLIVLKPLCESETVVGQIEAVDAYCLDMWVVSETEKRVMVGLNCHVQKRFIEVCGFS